MARVSKTTDHNPDGWPLAQHDRGYPGTQRCRSNMARLRAGEPACENVAVWRIRTTTRGLSATTYLCDQDKPEEKK